MCCNICQIKTQILKFSQCSRTKRQNIKKCKTKQTIIPKCPALERKNRDHRRDMIVIINTNNHPRRNLQLKYFTESLQNEIPHNRASLVPQMVKNLPPMQETWIQSQVGKIPWRRARQFTSVFLSESPWTEEPGGLQSTG